jgi:23S rRNA (adenine-N6)-dimethyltransferase
MPSRSERRARARRELGQNFLVDPGVARRLVALLDDPVPVIELGAGSGALTGELLATKHAVTAVEIDPHWVEHLRRRFPAAEVVCCDMREFHFPRSPHAVAGNLPYGITTTVTKRLLAAPGWSSATLLVQWEVARKRATGGTMLNAPWSPWYEFDLFDRVPARSFRPVPSVDGGILRIRRRHTPLLPAAELPGYQRFVEKVFTGPGRGVAGILWNLYRSASCGFPPDALPKDLAAADWVRLYTMIS